MNELLKNLGPESQGVGSSRWPAFQLTRVLAPVDFSPASRDGLAFAAQVAACFHARLNLLNVVESPSLPQWGYAHLAIRDAALRREAEEKLPEFAAAGGIEPRLIATQGHSAIQRLALGSVTEKVVRHAPCPVWVVRETEAKAASK